MAAEEQKKLVDLDTQYSIWDRFFTVSPLVVVGSRGPNGEFDLAPKHMAMPLSWENYFGFVCTPSHRTYQNIKQTEEFTVSFPNPDQVLLTSLSAGPRCENDSKPSLELLPTVPATRIEGRHLKDSYLFLECRLDRVVDGFGNNSLIAGKIAAARVFEPALRMHDRDDQDSIRNAPLLAYLPPGRYASIDESRSFPFPEGFSREPNE